MKKPETFRFEKILLEETRGHDDELLDQICTAAEKDGKSETIEWFEDRLSSINRFLSDRIKSDKIFREWLQKAIECSPNHIDGRKARNETEIRPLLRIESFDQGIGKVIVALEAEYTTWNPPKPKIGLWFCIGGVTTSFRAKIMWAPDPALKEYIKRYPGSAPDDLVRPLNPKLIEAFYRTLYIAFRRGKPTAV